MRILHTRPLDDRALPLRAEDNSDVTREIHL